MSTSTLLNEAQRGHLSVAVKEIGKATDAMPNEPREAATHANAALNRMRLANAFALIPDCETCRKYASSGSIHTMILSMAAKAIGKTLAA